MRVAPASLALAGAALLHLAASVAVVQTSPCAVGCGNVLTETTPPDVVCRESDYANTSPGQVFATCVNCELASNFTAGNQTDQQWLLYNVRYASSYCLFGDPGNPNIQDSPCITSTACGPLKAHFEWNNLTTFGGAFDYCQDWPGYQIAKCSACLLAGGSIYLNNFLTIMDAACQQKPVPGKTVSVDGSPFQDVPINITTPTVAPLYTMPPDHSPISLGGKVGIAAAGIIAILALAGFGVVCIGKRRRRAFLKDLERRHGDKGWPAPSTRYGNAPADGDMFETPVSQRPLRGWGDSPISVNTDHTEPTHFPRYISPYSSQYNSPVSAVEGPAMQNWPVLSPQHHHPTAWPSSSQEKAMQDANKRHQQHYAAPDDIPIGTALGGDEPSLRSKPSDVQLENDDDDDNAAHSKGKDISHSYRLPAEPEASALPHHDHAQYSLPRTQTSNSQRSFREWTDDDLKKGHVL